MEMGGLVAESLGAKEKFRNAAARIPFLDR